MVLSGRPGSGKTTALMTAATVLNNLPGPRSKVEVHRVFPGAHDNVSTLIGRFAEEEGGGGGAWEDGVCISLIRRALTV